MAESPSRLLLSQMVAALDDLTIQQTTELVIRFGVQLKTVDDIEHVHRGGSKLHSIQAWLNQDIEASWKKLVCGLQQMKMNVLAKQIAQQHCPELTVAGSSSTDLPATTVSVITPAPLVPVVPSPPAPPTTRPATPSDADLQTTPPSNDRSHPMAMMSVTAVKSVLPRLKNTFSKLISHTRSAMCERESKDREFLDELRDHLLFLPLAKKAIHAKFFRENEDDILEARNIRKLFAILGRYLSFQNYEILREIIIWFRVPPLDQNMKEYCWKLKKFELTTTVDVYIIAVPDEVTEDQKKAFSKMVVRINKPASECTLHEVRKMNEAIVAGSGLCPHSIYIGGMVDKCVEVVLQFPSRVAGYVLATLTPNFMEHHHITNVILDGLPLTTVPADSHDLNEELLSASESGDLVRVASLLNSGADIHTTTPSRETPLDRASFNGHLQVVCLLMGRGSNLESRDNDGYTPLISAAVGGRSEVVVELASLGANIDAQKNYGYSALMLAADNSKTDTVIQLVKLGANLNLQNESGYSALMRAAYNGKTDTVIQLVKLGANLNLQDKYGDSALMRAAYWGKTDTVIQLVKLGANLNLQNEDGDSAVIRAITSSRSNPEVVKELVRGKSNLNIQNQEGLTALIIAIRHRRSELVDVLLEGGEGIIDVDLQQNETGWSALFFAAESGNAAITHSLLAAQANPNLKDRNGLTALDIASASDRDTDDVCQLLAEASTAPHCPPDSPPPVQDTTLPQRHSPVPDQDTTLPQRPQRDSPVSDQDTTLPQRPQRDSPVPDQDTTLLQRDSTVTERDVLDTTQITQRRRQRRNVSETIRNLANKSRKVALNIFDQLDRRLKSTDKKQQMSSSSSQPEPDKEAKIEKRDKGPHSNIPTVTTSIK